MSILSCSHITKTFRRTLIPVRHLQERLIARRKVQWQVTAVHDVSLRLHRGEWVGLYGPNGCGKTTLLRILAGLLHQDSGTVDRTGSLSCFFDLSVGFHEEHTAEENVRIHALLQGKDPAAMDPMIAAVRSFSGIGDHWHLPLKCYSVGMRLRLGFAVAMTSPADTLLLDEVSAVGDNAFREQCWAHLQGLKNVGHSAIMVSHAMGDLQRVCDRILLMEKGRISALTNVS